MLISKARLIHKGDVFQFYYFPKPFSDPNEHWSIRPLKELRKHQSVIDDLRSLAQELGLTRFYAPDVQFGTRILNGVNLSYAYELGEGVTLRYNHKESADAIVLDQPKDASIFTVGGCPTLVATIDGETFIWAHLARNCLISRAHVLEKSHPRLHFSICDAIVERFGNHNARNIRAWIFASIPPDKFPHPVAHSAYAEFNKLLQGKLERRYGKEILQAVPIRSEVIYPDLPQLAKYQLMHAGVLSEHINTELAYLPEDAPMNGAEGAPRGLSLFVRS